MSENELQNRKGCNKNVVTFLIVAVVCVVAFLIVALVQTCSSDEKAKEEKKTEQKDQKATEGNVSMAGISDFEITLS